MPQKRLAKQLGGQRCLLNLVLLRVCVTAVAQGAGSRASAYLCPRFPPNSPSIYIISAFSVSALFSCMFPYTDEIMALIPFQLFKGASGRHSGTNPQIFFKAAAERQVDTPARTPAII